MVKKEYNSIPVEISNKIKDMILLDSRYGPGKKIPNEMELAQELNVSRNSIREAVKILVANNILRVERGRGTFVSSNPTESADVFGISYIQDKRKLYMDWFATRIALEPMIVACAAANSSPEEVALIRYWEQRCAEKIRADEDYSREDCQFHGAIAAASHNCVIERIMPMMVAAVEASTALNHQENAAATKENAMYYHNLIAYYVERGNPEAAAAMMTAHLQMGSDRLKYNR